MRLALLGGADTDCVRQIALDSPRGKCVPWHAGSLSGLGFAGCKPTAAVHFSPSFCPIAGLWACKSGKNCPRWGRFWLRTARTLSVPQARQAPRALLLALDGARGKAAPGRAAALHCDGRTACRLPCAARSHGPSRNSLRSLRSLRSNNRDESDDEARCARGRAPCAPRRRRGAPQPTQARLCKRGFGFRCGTTLLLRQRVVLDARVKHRCSRPRNVFAAHTNQSTSSRQALPGGGDFRGGEEHRAGVGARSALRQHSHRGCPSVESAANASSAVRPQPEHRSAGYTKCDRHRLSPRRVPPAATRPPRAKQEP